MSSRTLRRALVGAAMTVLLAGCANTTPGTDDGSPTPLSSPSVNASSTSETPEPSATPTATADSTPAGPTEPVDLGDPATWVVDFDRVGPFTIGLTVPELSALTGDFYESVYDTWEAECLTGSVQETGPIRDFYWLAEGPLGSERLATMHFTPFLGAGPFPRTADGLGLGSTLEEIQAVYGDALEYEGHEYEIDVTRVVIREGDLAMVFDVPEGGGTQAVTVGRYPAALYSEGCA